MSCICPLGLDENVANSRTAVTLPSSSVSARPLLVPRLVLPLSLPSSAE